MTQPTTIYQRPAELLQHLIRFDTTNPPGNEAACINYIDGLLQSLGIQTTLLEKVPGRPNLIARLKGTGSAPPFLLYGHVDVVPTAGQNWTHHPFGGELTDGYIWGRGALDMKGGVAMMLSAFMRAKAENLSLPGDVILCIVPDEEVGGLAGARFLVEEHPDLFAGVKYAIGEFGGFTLYFGGKKFYTIQVAEKQCLWLRATLRGPAGHASAPIQGGATAKLARMLTALDQNRLPIHITQAARNMFEAIANGVDAPMDMVIHGLLDPAQADNVLEMMGDLKWSTGALLRNTVAPTVIRGGEAVNVIPATITVDMDARLVPGFTVEEMLTELQAVIGDEPEIEILNFDPGPGDPDMSLFNLLEDVLRESDPDARAIPLLLGGVTDGRFFAQLGIQTYGFLPMQLREDFNFTSAIHAADERIPADALPFGTDAIYRVLGRFGG